MTYKHLNTQELTFIYYFWKQGTKTYLAARALRRSAETVLVQSLLRESASCIMN